MECASRLSREAGGDGRAEWGEVQHRVGTEAGDDLVLVHRAGQQCLPAEEMLGAVEVPGRYRRQLGFGDQP